MFKKGFKWYNNSIIEGMFEDCPEGWVKGRLPVKEETRLKHINNNGVKKLTKEQNRLRIEKIKKTKTNRTKEEQDKYIQNLKEAWNEDRKNKIKEGIKNYFNNLSEEEKVIRSNKISTSLNNLSEEAKINRSKAISKGVSDVFTKDRKERYSLNLSKRFKGRVPWNRGKKMPLESSIKKSNYYKNLTSEELKSIYNKQFNTKKLNNSFNTSSIEVEYKNYLIEKFGEYNIETQYNKDPRYPFHCDFYIKSLDLFIELNMHWVHGGHPFNPNNEEDKIQLQRWQEKAKTSQFYKNAIHIWTESDVNKQKIAKDNNINYKVFYGDDNIWIF